MDTLLTLPDPHASALSIRAKALLFHEPRSLELLRHVERVARSEATALIIGETGTGKELIARHLHKTSGRRGPFIAVNCGAFTETLIDAELFGHESGAFTGASQARAGWFEAANGGTLFLDEIGDLTLGLQVKLLRVLQERQVVRLGSRRPIPLDVRLVAATNVDLVRAVEAQNFRADLYYRLSVARIDLPPLRERAGDILPLAEHFIGVYSERMSLGRIELSTDARDALQAYPWPGNIRELENVIHYALIVVRDGVIRASDLRFAAPMFVAPAPAAPPPSTAAALAARPTPHWAPSGFELDAPASLPDGADAVVSALQPVFERLLHERTPDLYQRLEAVLVHTAFRVSGENQVQSARLLGVTRNTLRTLLKRHGLLGPQTAAIGFDEVSLDEADALPAAP
jgi:sigma-54-specific transcriptional regulator